MREGRILSYLFHTVSITTQPTVNAIFFSVLPWPLLPLRCTFRLLITPEKFNELLSFFPALSDSFFDLEAKDANFSNKFKAFDMGDVCYIRLSFSNRKWLSTWKSETLKLMKGVCQHIAQPKQAVHGLWQALLDYLRPFQSLNFLSVAVLQSIRTAEIV